MRKGRKGIISVCNHKACRNWGVVRLQLRSSRTPFTLSLSLSLSPSLSFPYPFSRSPPRIGRKLHARFERCNVSIVYLRFREVQKRLSGISTGWILLLDCFTKDFKNIGKFVQLVTCDKLSLIIVSLISVRFDQVLYLLLRRNCNLVIIKWNYNKNK